MHREERFSRAWAGTPPRSSHTIYTSAPSPNIIDLYSLPQHHMPLLPASTSYATAPCFNIIFLCSLPQHHMPPLPIPASFASALYPTPFASARFSTVLFYCLPEYHILLLPSTLFILFPSTLYHFPHTLLSVLSFLSILSVAGSRRGVPICLERMMRSWRSDRQRERETRKRNCSEVGIANNSLYSFIISFPLQPIHSLHTAPTYSFSPHRSNLFRSPSSSLSIFYFSLTSTSVLRSLTIIQYEF